MFNKEDLYEEGMVSNCCDANIAGVYDGVGRCTDCHEMAEAVAQEQQPNIENEEEKQRRKEQAQDSRNG